MSMLRIKEQIQVDKIICPGYCKWAFKVFVCSASYTGWEIPHKLQVKRFKKLVAVKHRIFTIYYKTISWVTMETYGTVLRINYVTST